MLNAGIDVNTKNLDGQNCLLALAQKQFYHRDFNAIAKLLIDNNIDLNAQLKSGMNILIYLSESNGGGKLKLSTAELLIRNGINLNTRTKTGYNVLLSLLKNQNLPTPKEHRDLITLVQLVLQKGIDINQKKRKRHECSTPPLVTNLQDILLTHFYSTMNKMSFLFLFIYF